MAKTPPSGAIRYFQQKTIRPPAIMPAMAPCRLDRRQNRAISMEGPKVAPKPAHAKETTRNTELSGFQASTRAIRAISTTVPRAASMVLRWSSWMPKKSVSKSWDTLEEAASSWESAVDMVAARMPARMMPATMASTGPFLLIRLASWTIMVSDSALVSRKGILPATDTL